MFKPDVLLIYVLCHRAGWRTQTHSSLFIFFSSLRKYEVEQVCHIIY